MYIYIYLHNPYYNTLDKSHYLLRTIMLINPSLPGGMYTCPKVTQTLNRSRLRRNKVYCRQINIHVQHSLGFTMHIITLRSTNIHVARNALILGGHSSGPSGATHGTITLQRRERQFMESMGALYYWLRCR